MTKGKGRDPGAGNMKKHLNLKDHKERQQPKARRHLGTLEKHKDYVERAKIHHAKDAKVKELRKKAAEKNPEEFHFGMVRGRMDLQSGAHVANADKKTTTDDQKKVNASDIRFLEWRRQQMQRDLMQKAENSVDFSLRTREHTRTSFLYDNESPQATPRGRLVATHTPQRGEAVGLEGPQEERDFAAEDPDDLIRQMDLSHRVGMALRGLRLEQNLISKGRRRLVTMEAGHQVYKWATKRRR